MAKLKALILVIALCLLGVFFYYTLNTNEAVAPQQSVFGRNIYSSNFIAGDTANPNYSITFPKDHGAHPSFDIEWWYLTANLQDQSGNDYGMQWTLFRFTNPNRLAQNEGEQNNSWNNQQMYMAHASVHSPSAHWFSEKLARGGVGNASVNAKPFEAFIDGWTWQNTQNTESILPSSLQFTANKQIENSEDGANSAVAATFALTQTGPFVAHGENGYSVKSTGDHASHYYSAPFIDIQGELRFSNQQALVQLKGKAWFDHEWTSQLLDQQTNGWDWLSLHLDNGNKIMAFRMRLNDMPDFITGTYINADGSSFTLNANQTSLVPSSTSEVNDKVLPLNWQLNIPSKNIALNIEAIKRDQYNQATVPYYEGMVRISGTHTGRGFIELTGY